MTNDPVEMHHGIMGENFRVFVNLRTIGKFTKGESHNLYMRPYIKIKVLLVVLSTVIIIVIGMH
jgi:hypothetical protein